MFLPLFTFIYFNFVCSFNRNFRISRGKPTFSSSILDRGFEPNLANDGNYNQVINDYTFKNVCFVSQFPSTEDEFWMVDLIFEHDITSIQYYNQIVKGVPLPVRHSILKNKTNEINSDNRCNVFGNQSDHRNFTLSCVGQGRYVKISMPKLGKDYLRICELDVFGKGFYVTSYLTHFKIF